MRAFCLLLLPFVLVNALTVPKSSDANPSFEARGLLNAPYTVPQSANNVSGRAAEILVKQATFLYGPPVAGGPYYPTGPLGLDKAAADTAAVALELASETVGASLDAAAATLALPRYSGLKTLQDYTKLYDGEWKNTLPTGPDPGMLTNYTQDLLFSMERLSISPYAVRRLSPSSDSLAFQIDDKTAQNVSGTTLQQLFQAGRLFYADYRNQAGLPSTGRYAAACDAYFYIDPRSGDFLPLAIRTNIGSNLIYTPADTAADWLLAKMMYNVNDFWFAQLNHLALVHEVVQISYMAAIRTLSDSHPVLAVLNRLMYEVFAIQPLAQLVLFNPGAGFDQILPFTGQAGQDFATTLYKTNGSGRFQANYFTTDLQRRGLIKPVVGPALEHFPFYEDVSVIYKAIQTFMKAFVQSYYASDSDVAADTELQAWATEANGPAKAIDFPTDISSMDTLVDVLTHFAHLASPSHHTVNTNELLSASSTLPFHPPSLYKPIPTTKGVANVASFLPPFAGVLKTFALGAEFARPQLVGTNRTLLHMFDDQKILSRMNAQTKAAAAKFMDSMRAFSAQVSARSFDMQGMSQGMPFVWKALDPNVAPYSVTI